MNVEELVRVASAINGQGTAAIPPELIYSTDELAVLARTAVSLPYGSRCLEIGTYVGRSASILFNLQAARDLTIILIDNWGWNGPDARKSFDELVRNDYPKTPFIGCWTSSMHAFHFLHCEPSKLGYDYIHVDGSHDEGAVRADISTWVLQRLNQGGIVCFHDYDYPGVSIPVNELLAGWPEVERSGRVIALRRPYGRWNV